MHQKRIILLLFFIGFSITSMNAYSFFKGFSAVESLHSGPPPEHPVDKTERTHTEAEPLQDSTPSYGEQYGHLLIPKLDSKIPIYYGAEEEQLKQGIGHVEKTALPGEDNNTVLSGHRDTVFRHLGKIEKGDRFIIETDSGRFTYQVKKIRIVDKENRTVIVPKPKATLTVITCYPFGYFGNAPQRFVLIADLIAANIEGDVPKVRS